MPRVGSVIPYVEGLECPTLMSSIPHASNCVILLFEDKQLPVGKCITKIEYRPMSLLFADNVYCLCVRVA
jgi:hypothetical protein